MSVTGQNNTVLAPLSPLDQNLLEAFSFTIGYVLKTPIDRPSLKDAAIRLISKWRLLSGHVEWSKPLSSWCIRVPLTGDVSNRVKFTTSQLTASSLDQPFSVFDRPNTSNSQILIRPPTKYFIHSSTPSEINSYASSKAPLLSIHVTELSNATCVGITVPHGVFDAIGLGYVLKALNNEFNDRPWEVPPLTESNIMREALKDISSSPPLSAPAASKEWLSGFNGVIRKATLLNKFKFVLAIVYDLIWHKVEFKGVYLADAVVKRLSEEVKKAVGELSGGEWVSTGDILSAWFVKAAYARDLDPKATLSLFVSIRDVLCERDPAFTNYHRQFLHNSDQPHIKLTQIIVIPDNGIVVCCTPLLTKKELCGTLPNLSLHYRHIIHRDIPYIQSYMTFTESFKGSMIPNIPRGQEMWFMSNQLTAHYDDLDLGSEMLALWHWNSPVVPSNFLSMNRVGGGYLIQGNVSRHRWGSIEKAVKTL
ncbi:hypothetical protein H0H93_008253 [Arthromyces matolae]|nr:hypothetical protein H0H93_008253 [Arthromyces matolae]